MSRGGRGGFRGGFGGAGNMPPMGLTFGDLHTMSREQTALYPEVELHNLSSLEDEEEKAADLQNQLIDRLHRSKYHIIEETKKADIPRYSDKFYIGISRPTLVADDLHKEFFPPGIWEMYFNPKKKIKKDQPKQRKKINLNDLGISEDDAGEDEDEDDQNDDAEEELGEYEEEEDDDYNENYFETGSQDDADDIGGDEGGGGGGDD